VHFAGRCGSTCLFSTRLRYVRPPWQFILCFARSIAFLNSILSSSLPSQTKGNKLKGYKCRVFLIIGPGKGTGTGGGGLRETHRDRDRDTGFRSYLNLKLPFGFDWSELVEEDTDWVLTDQAADYWKIKWEEDHRKGEGAGYLLPTGIGKTW
jgi:hypothetical protein